MRNSRTPSGSREPHRTLGRKRLLFPRQGREITAPDSLIQRIGAEDIEAYFSPLKPELREDGGDTKD